MDSGEGPSSSNNIESVKRMVKTVYCMDCF